MLKIPIILASASPRRKQLMEQHGLEFQVIETHADENVDENLPPRDHALAVAQRKAVSAVTLCKEANLGQVLIITADTIVTSGNQILGKPRNEEHALDMLKTLQDDWHQVYTGLTVTLADNGKVINCKEDCICTNVRIRKLTEQQLREYIKCYKPLDKAGAYGIQDDVLVEEIDGDYTNVVGLPMEKLIELLKKA